MSFLESIEGEFALVAEALHDHWLKFFHSERECIMARIDDLQSAVSGIAPAIDRLIALHSEMAQKLEAAGQEDPRIGQMADDLAAMKVRIEAIVPAPEPDAVAAETAQQ